MKFDRLVAFLRSNNDIDHVAPVVYKWAETLSEPVTIVLRDSSLESDFRVEFLSRYDTVEIVVLGDLLTGSSRIPSGASYTVTKAVRELKRTIGFDVSYRSDATAILDYCVRGDEETLLAFDYLPGRGSLLYALYEAVIREASARGHTTVALPHGGGNLANALIRSDKLSSFIAGGEFTEPGIDLQALYFESHTRMDIVDYIVTPNKLFRRRFEHFVDRARLRSPCYARFTEEWIDILRDITPRWDGEQPSDSLLVVLFLGRLCCHMSREDIELTVDFVSSLPSIRLAVKNHPRETIVSNVDNFEHSERIEIVDGIPSPTLLEVGDVFLDTGSSVVYDAVARGKPILELDYLHSNESVFSSRLPACAIGSYDGLYHTLTSLVTDHSEFYDESYREQFVEEYIGRSDGDELREYIELFDSLATIPSQS